MFITALKPIPWLVEQREMSTDSCSTKDELILYTRRLTDIEWEVDKHMEQGVGFTIFEAVNTTVSEFALNYVELCPPSTSY